MESSGSWHDSAGNTDGSLISIKATKDYLEGRINVVTYRKPKWALICCPLPNINNNCDQPFTIILLNETTINNNCNNQIIVQQLKGVPQVYSRALTMASLASMLIWTSALAASSDAPANSDWAFSRLALAA